MPNRSQIEHACCEANQFAKRGIRRRGLLRTDGIIEFLDQQLTIVCEVSDRLGEANASWNLGELLIIQGARERGLALMQVRVDYLRKLGHADAEKSAAYVEKLRREGTK